MRCSSAVLETTKFVASLQGLQRMGFRFRLEAEMGDRIVDKKQRKSSGLGGSGVTLGLSHKCLMVSILAVPLSV
jgi:hypothetical protein